MHSPQQYIFSFLNPVKWISILLIYLTACLQFYAQSVTPEEASQVAENFLYQSEKKLKSSRVSSKLKMTHTEKYLGHPIFYIFNSTEHDGFILVSANKGFYPVLGFSHRGSFDQDALPPGLSELLDTYKKKVVELTGSDTIPPSEYNSDWDRYTGSSSLKSVKMDTVIKEVKPLLNTTWNSGCLYNSHCPVDPDGPCGHAKVGCVAVAMAQILKYYASTEQPRHKASYTHEDYGYLSVDFDSVTYHWERMPAQLESENEDVTRFLFHCGVSIHMGYGPTFSGASMNMAGNALINHFNYSGKIQEIWNYDDRYSTERWGNVLRNELDNFRPVYCAGDPPNYGSSHAYIVDGYLGDELLHYNWGWGGKHDGYFAVGAPYAMIGVKPDPCENDTLRPISVRNPSYLVGDDSVIVSWLPLEAEDGDRATQYSLDGIGFRNHMLYEPAFQFKWDSIGIYNFRIKAFDDCRIPSDSVTPLTVVVPDSVNYLPRTTGVFPSSADTIPVYSGVKKIFSFDHSDPNKDTLTFEWLIDNEPIPDIDTSRLVYDFSMMEPGIHSLTVKVSDHQLTRNKTWILKKVEHHISILDDRDSISQEGNWYDQVETNAHYGSLQWASGTGTPCPSAEYHFLPEKEGNYKLSAFIPVIGMAELFGSADSAIYEISINNVIMDSILVDQGANLGNWVYLDSLDLLSDVQVSVRVMNHDAVNYWDLIVIDAVKFVYTDRVDMQAPDLYVIDTLCQGEYLEATCSETGWIYLVPAGTEKDLAVIKQVCLDSVISISKAVVSVPVSGKLEGTYWLYARNIHGNLSDPVAFIVAAIDKVVSEKFNIYPNPVFDILTIRSNISGDYILEITSLNGRVIHRQHITDKTHRLDISSFRKGVYFISIRSKDFTTTRKIIKLQ